MNASKYTIIENPEEVRKNFLMSSKSLIQVLMIYEKLKVIRREKLEKMNQLKSVVEEAIELMDKLFEQLPQVKDETSDVKEKKQEHKTSGKGTGKKEKSVSKRTKKNKIDKLYEQLKQIDDILKKYN